MSTSRESQHYIPQFMLRNFAFEGERVWVLDKTTSRVYASAVRKVGHQINFYRHQGRGGGSIDLEALMGRYDSDAAPVVQAIVETGKLVLTATQRPLLASFLACQMVRTPKTLAEMSTFREEVVAQHGPQVRVPGDPQPVGEYDTTDDKWSSLQFIETAPAFARMFEDKAWVLLEAPPGHAFITSDNPVVRYNGLPGGGLGLRSLGIDIYYPISPRFCLQAVCPISAAVMRTMPGIGGRFSLALSEGTPLVLEPENVVFVNAQQVIWAERFLFARAHDDLASPVQMLADHPEFRVAPREVESDAFEPG